MLGISTLGSSEHSQRRRQDYDAIITTIMDRLIEYEFNQDSGMAVLVSTVQVGGQTRIYSIRYGR